ncbi:hypothetical protein TEA_012502 [Camellia sinensis var. sinensis]|uniref:Remorin C-terminal domain-containing protein n=1 Tax=Camellia sinensis var. sinensis TaxID=542762 RepID=A0A4S4E8X1_CAMSN|nr:hypothetical protein TEA_012502 [Camellia sinensis var. sinensis]
MEEFQVTLLSSPFLSSYTCSHRPSQYLSLAFALAVALPSQAFCSSSGGNFAPVLPPTSRWMDMRYNIMLSKLVQHALLALYELHEKFDSDKDAATNISWDVSRRDMATQMSPEGSPYSSPRRLSFSPSTPFVLPIVELESPKTSKLEVRDIHVDEWLTVTRMKRKEAKITAWKNLEKAKAEAAISMDQLCKSISMKFYHVLSSLYVIEMKLEKKRSSSMDKIMKKLRSAQKKDQEMRRSVLTNLSHQVVKTSNKLVSFRRTCQISSLSGCFTCHAF